MVYMHIRAESFGEIVVLGLILVFGLTDVILGTCDLLQHQCVFFVSSYIN